MKAKLPRVTKRGFFLPGPGAQVLLLHGYTGSPYDLKPLAISLNRHGLAVSVPLLLGHGTQSEKIWGVSGQQWLEQAKAELLKLDQSKDIFIGGLSMGALLAILLVSSSKPRGLLLFSPALKLKFSAEMLISAARFGLIKSQASMPKFSGKSDIADPEARKKSPSYPDMPISGLLEFDALRKRANEELEYLSIPIFVAFARHDGAIDLGACRSLILSKVLGPVLSKSYSRSQHVVTLDYDREILFNDVWQFITNYLGP